MRWRISSWVAGAFLAWGITSAHGVGPWRYQLLYGSTVSISTGGRVTGFSQGRGSFDLRLVEATGLGERYAVDGLEIVAFETGRIRGGGILEVSPAGVMNLSLDAVIDGFAEGRSLHFTNVVLVSPDRKWPMVCARARMDAAVEDAVYTINMVAAPFRDIWISSAVNFKSAGATIGHGDVLSVDGRVVGKNDRFFGNGIDRGLDAMSLTARGVAFSPVANDGQIVLQDGRAFSVSDIFTNRTAFAGDPGIDGIQFLSRTQLYFSVTRSFDYEGNAVRDGDIWWTDLETHELRQARSREELFSFRDYEPWKNDPTVGIDSFYIWPWGETWFSLRSSWTAHTAIYSSDGYGIYTDTFAFEKFHPDVDPGLDLFLVITDADLHGTPATLRIDKNGRIERSLNGAAFQLEAAETINGPYLPISPIGFGMELFFDPGVNGPSRFFRMRQW